MKRPSWGLTTSDLRLIRSCLGKLTRDKAISTNRDRKKRPYITLRDTSIIVRRCTVSVLTCPDISFTHDWFSSSLLIMSLLLCTGARGGDLTVPGAADSNLALEQTLQL
jgi:hypothetical protein